MSAAWVLAAHRSARQRPDRALGPQGADAIRRALSPDRAGRRPLDGVVAVGDRPRAVGLRAGLDPSHPVVAVQGVGLCALAQAVGSISGAGPSGCWCWPFRVRPRPCRQTPRAGALNWPMRPWPPRG